MTAISVSAPFPILTDIDGDPLDAGYVYIGQPSLDPAAFPKAAYWDASLTTPAAQPIRTTGGYPVRNGSPARIYTDGDYSIRINNKNGTLVYSSPASTDRLDSWQIGYDGGTVQDVLDAVTGPSGAASVGYMPADAGAVATTVQAKLRETVSVFDFMTATEIQAVKTNTWTTVSDVTAKVQAALNATGVASVYFPAGTYRHTGLSITRAIDVIGAGRYRTVLQNISPGTAITFQANVERGVFRDIAINGNGTQPFGADATSGKGFAFANNAVIWTFERVWMRGHGDHFFFANGVGHVNNINIIDSQLEYGKKSAIHFIQSTTANQINIINIQNCNISGFGQNGIEVWGQNINITNNSIQACKSRGIVVDGSMSTSDLSSVRGLRICGNYFELCNYGFIYMKSIAFPYARYLIDVLVSSNYGDYSKIPGDTVDESTVSLLKIEAPDWYAFDNLQVSAFTYESNMFYSSSLPSLGAILDCGNVISFDSKISRTLQGGLAKWASLHKNLGAARILDNWSNKQVVKGISACVSHTFTQEKSPSVTVTTDFVFDVRNAEKGNIVYVGVPVETDSTSYTVSLIKKYRSVGSVAAYSTITFSNMVGRSGNGLAEYEPNTNTNVITTYEDFYLVIRISFQSAATYCYIHNPIIGYSN